MNISIDLIKKLRDMTLAPLWSCKDALIEAEGDIDQAQEILKRKWAIKADKNADRETNAWVVKFVINNWALVGIKLLCETDFVSKNDSFLGLVDQIVDMISKESQDINPDAVPETLLDGITALLKDNAVKIGENMKPAYIIKRTGTVAVYNHMGNNLSSAVFYSGDVEAFAKDCTLQVAAMNPLYISVDNVDKSRIDALTQEFTEEMSTVDKPADIKNKIIEWKVQKALQDDILLEQVSIKDPTKKIKELMPQWSALIDMIRVSI